MKNIRTIIIFLFFCRCILLNAAGEYRERVYIQTDKQVYLAGELVWLKMYVIGPDGRPSPLSRVGYVELLNEESDILQAKIELKEGAGPGWLELPITIPSGNYRLVGYTRYMRNEGEEVYFNKEISVINTFRTDKTVRIISSDFTEDQTTVKPVSTIDISTDKTAYPVRSEVKITLSRLPAGLESVAVSVAGTDLPTGFSPTTIQAWRNQLLVMSQPPFSGEYIPEYEGHIIHGKIVPLEAGKEDINDPVTGLLAFPGDDIRVFAVQANKTPDVQFYTSFNQGRHEIVTTTLSPSSTLYRLDIQTPFVNHTPRRLSSFALRSGWEKELQERSVGLQLQHMFTGDSLSRIRPAQTWFRTKPDWKYDFDEYTRFSTMEEVVIEFLLPLRFRRINGKRTLSILKEDRLGFTFGNSMVLLDGIPLVDHELLFNYDPFSLKQVEVYSGHFVFGGQMFDGIASFYTFNNDYPGLVLDASSQLFDYEGTRAYRYFYMPDYRKAENKDNYLPDARHTLVWNPELQTGGASAVELSFYTSDLTGEFTITVEGITKDGKAVYATHAIQVR